MAKESPGKAGVLRHGRTEREFTQTGQGCEREPGDAGATGEAPYEWGDGESKDGSRRASAVATTESRFTSPVFDSDQGE